MTRAREKDLLPRSDGERDRSPEADKPPEE
jgi:hypothetical protein